MEDKAIKFNSIKSAENDSSILTKAQVQNCMKSIQRKRYLRSLHDILILKLYEVKRKVVRDAVHYGIFILRLFCEQSSQLSQLSISIEAAT